MHITELDLILFTFTRILKAMNGTLCCGIGEMKWSIVNKWSIGNLPSTAKLTIQPILAYCPFVFNLVEAKNNYDKCFCKRIY